MEFIEGTSDSMDRWRRRGGKSQRREEQKREDHKGERIRRKKIQVRKKVAQSRNTVFFQWFVAPEGRRAMWPDEKLRAVAVRTMLGPLLEVEMSKMCMPLWREAHFQVKMYKAHQGRSTFGSCDVEKVHAVVARNTFPSQNAQNTSASENFWKLWCRKSARRCSAKHISKSKVQRTDGYGAFWTFRCAFAWPAQRIVHLVKSEKNARVF